MEIINLTLHDVTIKMPDGSTKVIPKSGMSVRCDIPMEQSESIDGIPTKVKRLDRISTCLPAPEDGKIFLVSSMVLDACPARHDLIAPDTSKGGAIRDVNGRIIAVRGVQRNPIR